MLVYRFNHSPINRNSIMLIVRGEREREREREKRERERERARERERDVTL